MKLVLWMEGIPIKEWKHPQSIVRDLGIVYKSCRSNTIPSNWVFYDVEPSSVPKELPDYIDILD